MFVTGIVAYMLTVFLGSLAACRIILEIGGKHCINDQDNQSRNALHLATIGGHGDVCNFLLENGGKNTDCRAWSVVKSILSFADKH